jgi:hypothetical protein
MVTETYQLDSDPRSSAGAYNLMCVRILKVTRDINRSDHLLYDMLVHRFTRRVSSVRRTILIDLHAVSE